VGFLASKAFGDKGENAVKCLLDSIGVDVNLKGKGIEYDLECKLKRKKFTIEVKYDWMAQKTGNLAIEYYNTKKNAPSGIDATEADIWCVCLEDGENITIWMTPTSLLRRHIKENKPYRTVEGGDNNSAMKLYRQDDILSIFVRIDDKLSAEETLKTLKKILKGI